MKATSACDHCFLRQAQDAATRLGLAPAQRERLLQAVHEELAHIPATAIPPLKASRVHALIRRLSGNPDPYHRAKHSATAQALARYPALKQRIGEAADPLDSALRLAIAGNIIDLGAADSYDLEASIERVLHCEPAIDHRSRLRARLAQARSVLYLADNAGETVMDRLFIERLDKPVTYVVKGAPAVNDATLTDARAAGLEACCSLIDNGAPSLGTLLEQCSADFVERFWQTDLIIAKGMANYESLAGSRPGLFFLLQAKCAVIAQHLGVAEKSIIVLEDEAP